MPASSTLTFEIGEDDIGKCFADAKGDKDASNPFESAATTSVAPVIGEVRTNACVEVNMASDAARAACEEANGN